MSYAQLDALIRAAAARLGPRPGVVGISTARSPGTIVGLLGVWAAGGTYCPVDPTFPAERRQAMLAAAGCRTLLAAEPDPEPSSLDGHGSAGPRPDGHGTNGRGLDGRGTAGPGVDGPDADGNGPTGLPPRAGTAFDPEEPAYILFTSGSTGEPKPVVTPRRAIATSVRALHGLFGLTPDDRVLQFASLNWDTCFEEILPTLTVGAALVFHDEAHSGSFPRFLRMVENERVTVLNLPTAFWHELVHYQSDAGVGMPACVRAVVIGGEAVSPARLADWCDLDTAGIRLVNTYGCTETTLITHAVDLHGPHARPGEAPWRDTGQVPIGWSLPHVVELVSDEGELLVGGPALALGYRGLVEATEARFVTDAAGERYFRTGDRVRRSPDGMLVPAGRLDHEVKVRGIRVDPGEVEAQIAGHPGVGAVAVLGVTVARRTALLAYVVPRPHADAGTLDADILAYLRSRVPGHLVPSRIAVVGELVYTASGKVDRARSHQRQAAHDRSREPLR